MYKTNPTKSKYEIKYRHRDGEKSSILYAHSIAEAKHLLLSVHSKKTVNFLDNNWCVSWTVE